ncbi:hypothetical protein P153DRAFT_334856 [Dothidotthia symphoricarpi CBS 119687]|uniref:Cytochrome b561 domain-containing protein n=1 Tax=Dothidotthia symphoricarpi CBS 119687 TaxID=1392245 RepID=A0A6A6AM42_9PLEO|nr:uncharacterized protein P153DRAFT_334856 [Dothidotthia symphoricarpi CBS 119687]KAF2132198.1 hypothetical protein P153DRAFT_334856 [Dothidotthia symphoricarpi CBS 119687]
MSTNGLSAPGSSVYNSDSMYVGDGTWDSQRNTFLLPNLLGLNFETMRLNGMGNRFRDLVGYQGLITAHGTLAAITFLFVVPGAIFMARFYHRNPHTALRFHIWLQILTVLLATASIVLGFQAVGRERSLSNPHHGIGVALYSLVILQFLGGAIIHKLEKGKERWKIPLKLMFHQWLGRIVAVLGIVQIPLGLTLWGSPLVLFILYAVWAFILLVAYFVLSYTNQPEMDFDDGTTYITERTGITGVTGITGTSLRSRRSRVTGAGAGLAALHSRQSRSRSRVDSRSRVTDSRFTESYLSDEKFAPKKGASWKDRLLGAGAAAGGIFAMKSLFGRDKRPPPTETGSDISYSRPLGPSEVTSADLSRVEEGRAPASPANNRDWRRVEEREAAQAAAMGASPLRQGHPPARSGTSMESFDSRTSLSYEHETRTHEDSYGVKDGVKTLGVMGFLKHSFSKRKNKKEDERVEALRQEDLEQERIARSNSNRRKFTGDGVPPRKHRVPSTIYSESDITGITPSVAPRHNTRPPPMESTIGASTAPIRPPPSVDPYSVLSDSGSEAYNSPGGRHHRRHRSGGTSGLAAGTTALSTGSPSKRDNSRRRGSRDGSVSSPPVSVKVKMHNDGRHVTLRRLNEEEAAAEREARRRERQRRNRNGSMSSLSNLDNDRWRRTEAMEAAQAQEMAQSAAPSALSHAAPIRMPEPYVPPPPPGPPPANLAQPGPSGIPPPPSMPTGVVSPPPALPGAAASVLSSPVYGTETDLSNYDSNRRRRRAERAQAKQARMGGSRVEFS